MYDWNEPPERLLGVDGSFGGASYWNSERRNSRHSAYPVMLQMCKPVVFLHFKGYVASFFLALLWLFMNLLHGFFSSI